MSYGVKYRTYFVDHFGRDHRVDILKNGYSGAITEITHTGATPVEMSVEDDGINRFKPIRGTLFQLVLDSSTDLKFSEFFNVEVKEYQIKYYVEDTEGTNPELVTNGDFANWTDDNPDGWTVVNEDGSNYITEANDPFPEACRMVSDNSSNVYMYQDIGAVTNEVYKYSVEVPNHVSGSVSMYTFPGPAIIYMNATGIYTGDFVATGSNLVFDGAIGDNVLVTWDDVSIKKKYKLFWTGWVQPDMYSEPFTAPGYFVQLQATEGLGDLRHYLYESATDTPYTGEEDLLDIIEKCLDNTGLDLELYSACNIFETNQTSTDNYDPLFQTWANQELFQDDLITAWSCYDVLTAVCKIFGARLQQIWGAWHLLPSREIVKLSYDRRIFASGGFGTSTNDTYSARVTATDNQQDDSTICHWVDGNQTIEIIPAYRKLTFIQNYHLKDNLVKNGDFNVDYWDDSTTPSFWTTSSTDQRRWMDSVYFPNNAVAVGDTEYISQELGNVESGGSYFLDINFTYISYVLSINIAQLNVMIKINGDSDKWLDETGTWKDSEDYIHYTETSTDIGDVQSRRIISDAIPVDGTLSVQLHELTISSGTAKVRYTNVSVKIIPSTTDDYLPGELKIHGTGQTNNFTTHEDALDLGDLPDKYNNEIAYRGGLLLPGGACSLWVYKDEFKEDTLLNHLMYDYLRQYDYPTTRLNGTLYSKILDFNSVLIASANGIKTFIQGRMLYRPKEGLWQGEWLEMKEYTEIGITSIGAMTITGLAPTIYT